MRNEMRYKWVYVILVILLLAMIVAVQVRLNMALPYVSPGSDPLTGGKPEKENETLPVGIAGTISTRDGEVFFDGTSTKYSEFYAVGANVASGSGKHLAEHTLAFQYRNELAASTLTVMGGLHSFQGRSGCQMTTTLLPGTAHQTLHQAFGDHWGSLYAYNYKTGEVYVDLSLPSAQSGTEEEGYLNNRVLGAHTPGSTIKIVTLICALTQNPELEHFTYTCSGVHVLPSGSEVTCGDPHYGPLDMGDAIGYSCNCYFAALIGQMDPAETCKVLEQLGFNTSSDKSQTANIDRLLYRRGYATFESNTNFDHIWKLIGQGSTVSLVDMARIAGAVAAGGSSADPYIVQSIYDPNDEVYTHQAGTASTTQLVDPDVASTLWRIWSEAVADYYHTKKVPVDKRITLAKTGTSENTDKQTGEEYHNRLMVGVMADYDVAFMLMVERIPAGDQTITAVANTLAQVIAEADLS